MSFYYLATPYSKYRGGVEDAFRLACSAAAAFVRAGIPVYAPIAHTHPIAVHGGLDPLDERVWLRADRPMMKASFGLIVLCAGNWRESEGIAEEIKSFTAMAKPVRYLDPAHLSDAAALEGLRESLKKPRLTLAQIAAHVSVFARVDILDMLSQRRMNTIVVPRQMAMALSREFTDQSLPKIGRYFERDHTTVIYAVRRIAEREAAEPEFKKDMDVLRARLAAILHQGRDEAADPKPAQEAA